MHSIAFLSDDPSDDGPVYQALRAAAQQNESIIVRIEDLPTRELLTKTIRDFLGEAELIVANVEHGKANLCYEIGIAHGLGKKVILVCESVSKLPFDLRGHAAITYARDDARHERLAFTLSEVIAEHFSRRAAVRAPNRVYTPYLRELPARPEFSRLLHTSYFSRARQLEQWFTSVAAEVPEWELEVSNRQSSGRGFDLVIWNNHPDEDLAKLGSVVLVELKATKTLTASSLRQIAELVEKRGLSSLILATTAESTSGIEAVTRDLLARQGFILVLLDRTDLRDVVTPADLVATVKRRLVRLRHS